LKWFFVQAQLQIGPVLHPGCAFQFMELEFGDNFIAPVLKLFFLQIHKEISIGIFVLVGDDAVHTRIAVWNYCRRIAEPAES